MDKECCGTCLWRCRDNETDEWCCNHPEADEYGLEIEYEYCCDKYDNWENRI